MPSARSKQSRKAKTKQDDVEPKLCAGRDRRAVTVFLIVSVSLLALDLLVKFLAFQHIDLNVKDVIIPNEKIILIPYGLAFQLTLNEGAVFGMGQGGKWFFVLVSLVAVTVISRAFWKSDPKARWFQLSLAMILSGAMGNLYDRVRFSRVRDMIKIFPDVHLPFGLNYPGGVKEIYPWIFNIADVALLFGVGILITILWRQDSKKQSAQEDSD